MGKHDLWELQSMQAAPLNVKVLLTKQRIREWVHEYGIDGVYVSFSGGKDSTVLLHICREMYPEMKAVFSDTGLEYPEIREFVKTFDNVDWVKPKMTFKEVICKYGYPMISKEVAECVYGARRYLTSVMESETVLTDRQTDRQTGLNFRINTGLKGYVDSVSLETPTWGGYDNKYRKLRGIGEYTNTNSRNLLEPEDMESNSQMSDNRIPWGGRSLEIYQTHRYRNY